MKYVRCLIYSAALLVSVSCSVELENKQLPSKPYVPPTDAAEADPGFLRRGLTAMELEEAEEVPAPTKQQVLPGTAVTKVDLPVPPGPPPAPATSIWNPVNMDVPPECRAFLASGMPFPIPGPGQTNADVFWQYIQLAKKCSFAYHGNIFGSSNEYCPIGAPQYCMFRQDGSLQALYTKMRDANSCSDFWNAYEIFRTETQRVVNYFYGGQKTGNCFMNCGEFSAYALAGALGAGLSARLCQKPGGDHNFTISCTPDGRCSLQSDRYAPSDELIDPNDCRYENEVLKCRLKSNGEYTDQIAAHITGSVCGPLMPPPNCAPTQGGYTSGEVVRIAPPSEPTAHCSCRIRCDYHINSFWVDVYGVTQANCHHGGAQMNQAERLSCDPATSSYPAGDEWKVASQLECNWVH